MAAITHRAFPEGFGRLISSSSIFCYRFVFNTRFDTPNAGSERFARAKIFQRLSFYFVNGFRSCGIRVPCIDPIEQSQCLRDFLEFILGASRRPLSVSMNHPSPRSLHNFNSKITRVSDLRTGHRAGRNSRFCVVTSIEYIRDWLVCQNGRLLVIAYVNYALFSIRALKK